MTKIDECFDCKIDMLDNNERPYTIDMGFLGEIQICYNCMITRGLNECDICGDTFDKDDITEIEGKGLFCYNCKDDQ